MAFSCGLLQTRTPDPPSQARSNFTPATDPTIVFQNLSNAFSDLNVVNYLRCLADPTTPGGAFQFEPTANARLQYASVFAGWSKTSEQQYFQNAKSKLASGGGMTLEMTWTQQGIASDSAQFDVVYTLTVQHTQPNVPTVAVGKGQMVLAVDQTRSWVIRRWVDIANNATDFTWSDLKGTFGQ